MKRSSLCHKLFFVALFLLAGVFFASNTHAQSVYYGVSINETSGAVSGYAWNDGIGWIDFSGVTYNPANGQLSGNANITGLTAAGQNGQLIMRGDCTPTCGGYGVTIDLVTKNFSGYAWNDKIGWVWFASTYSTVTEHAGQSPSVTGYAWNDNIGWISMSQPLTVPPAGTCDASLHNTCLYAWSDNIGWISHNSVDNPSIPKYGVNIDATSGAVSGYAWSDAAGWIDFGPTSGFPAAPSNGVTYNSANGQLSGWAQIVGYGANGWIKMRDTSPIAYGVTVTGNGDFSGYAWSDDFGWIDFAPSGYTPVKYDSKLSPSVYGWAWNDALGWISMAFTGYDVSYGVDVQADGRITGYAWSEIGWIQYDPAGTYPTGWTYSSKWDPNTGQVSGWAKAVGMTASWAPTSWIKMRSSAGDTVSYGVNIDRSTGLWSGYAWNDTFGWVAYNHTFGSVYTKFTATGPAAPVLTEPLNCVDTYTLNPTSPLSPTLDWSDYVALDGSTQAAYQIQVSDDPLFGTTVIDQTINSTASAYSIGLGQLVYNVAYYWRVRDQSSSGSWSPWGTTGVLGTETNCFRTPKHPAPVCNFTMAPAKPVLNQDSQFTDTTQYFGGATGAQWSWNFGDGVTVAGSNPLVHKNPKHKYTTSGNVTIIQGVTDTDGYACTKTVPASVSQNLPEFQHVIPR